MKERVIEICRNLEATLATMDDTNMVTSHHILSRANVKASRYVLEKKLKELKNKYKL